MHQQYFELTAADCCLSQLIVAEMQDFFQPHQRKWSYKEASCW